MRADTYKKRVAALVGARRFRRFTIKLENGESYSITHPENIVWGKDGHTMIYTGNKLRTVYDAEEVTAIQIGDGRR